MTYVINVNPCDGHGYGIHFLVRVQAHVDNDGDNDHDVTHCWTNDLGAQNPKVTTPSPRSVSRVGNVNKCNFYTNE